MGTSRLSFLVILGHTIGDGKLKAIKETTIVAVVVGLVVLLICI